MFLRTALAGAAVLATADAFMAPAAMVRPRSAVTARVGLAPMKLRTAAGSRSGVIVLQSVTKDTLAGAQKMVDELLDKTNANPVMVRLAWHDSGTFDVNIKEPWPKAGGAIGSIMYKPEIEHGANAGLAAAVELLKPIKEKYSDISWADLFQMASARSIELAGGPKLDMRYGRVDAKGPEDCSPEGNLPDAEAGPNGKYGGPGGTASTEDTSPNGHLRKVFYRMGLNDEEIVALSGAHTFGRAYKDRSGLGADKTKFTDGSTQMRADGKQATYKAGGSSWTKNWLKFDNSYFTTIPDSSADPELLKLSSDKTLFEDQGFKPYAEKFRDSQDEFFKSYAQAHVKLSELGSKFEPEEGIRLIGARPGVIDNADPEILVKEDARVSSEIDEMQGRLQSLQSNVDVLQSTLSAKKESLTLIRSKLEAVTKTKTLPGETFDLIVVGGGPAGLTAALTAADIGKSVAIIDGTPADQTAFAGPTGLFSKALRDSAKKVKVAQLREMGLLESSIWNQVETLTNDIVKASGKRSLGAIKAAQVPTVQGTAVLDEDDDPELSTLTIKRADGGEEVATCKKLLFATGSSPMRMRNLPYDDVRVFDSDSIKKLKFLPHSMVIVGSGIISIEYAKIFTYLETKVTLVIRGNSFEAALSRIGVDSAVAATLKSDLEQSGVEILLDAEVDSVIKPDDTNVDLAEGTRETMKIKVKKSSTGELDRFVNADVLMTATGRVANSQGLGLEEAGVKMTKGTIDVSGSLETSVPGVYAAGDVVGRPSLASTGIEQGMTAVKRMFDQDETVEGTWMDIDPNAGKDPASLTQNPLQYPIGIWTLPEMAFIGYTKESAEKAGFQNVAEGTAYYENTIRGRVQQIKTGLLKFVFEKPSGKIVGVHIIGEDACELIHYGTALAQSGKTVSQVLGTTFAAVTYHELFKLAAQECTAQLDADLWFGLLKNIGLDNNNCLLQSGLKDGLVDAGMNERNAREIASIFSSSECIPIDQALEAVKSYRVPGRYRMAMALKAQFSDSVEDDAKFVASAKAMFEKMDIDKGSTINKDEMIAGLAERGLTLSEAAANDLMASVDEDGSGEVDFKEFLSVLRKLVQA